ncbi:MAG: DNA repair protein RecN [Deltaproteobacteria bacterium]|nr:DNA repair protein RecN [Deltaproteobacteria bacterium]
MLEELSVQNYALIDRLTVRFSAGMNVLSGETGAGKSILVGALSLLHGARAGADTVRTGADEARVSGTFSVGDSPEVLAWLDDHGIEPEDGLLIIRRTVKQSGRGGTYVQSTPMTRNDLNELTGLMFDIHGQHEHQSLLSEENHRRVLDRFAGLEDGVARLRTDFIELSSLKKRFQHMEANERQRLREMDILQFAVREIDEAQPKDGEEDELETERRVLSQHERLYASLDEMYDAVSENKGGALAQIRTARGAMDTVTSIDDGLTDAAHRLDDLFYELEDVAETIQHYRGGIQFSPERLQEVESRLSLLRRLEKKYGSTIAEVLEYYEEAKAQIDGFETWEQDKGQLRDDIREREQSVLLQAQELSTQRKAVAGSLGERILSSLRLLGMPKTTLEVSVEPRLGESGKPSCGPNGIDQIAFLISPNPGEPVKPLASIASGGEISRVMLALKSALADNDHVGCMVFDEIDAGIGGEIAVAVGDHLSELSRSKQILCITHLATIAVRADTHIRVDKAVRNDRTVTEITLVKDDGRVEEIARMLAGDRTGAASRNHAEELLRKYATTR